MWDVVAWKDRSLLIYDTFEALLTKSGKAPNYFALVPGRLTSVLQPFLFLEKRNSWMQWMADHSHDFTMTDHTKNPSEDFTVSRIVGHWVTLNFPKRWLHQFFFSKHEFFLPVLHNHFYVFFFFSFKVHFKIRVHIIQYIGAYYSWVNMVLSHGKLNMNPNFLYAMNKWTVWIPL